MIHDKYQNGHSQVQHREGGPTDKKKYHGRHTANTWSQVERSNSTRIQSSSSSP